MESGISRIVECLKNGVPTHSESKRKPPKPSKLENTSSEVQNTITYVQVERKRLEAILKNGNLPDDTRVNLNASPTPALPPPPQPIIKNLPAPPPLRPIVKKLPAPPPPPLLNITQLNLSPSFGYFPQSINRQRSVEIPKSSVPLKSLNWVKLPETKLSGTIWADIDESKIYSTIDLETIDRLFCAHQNQKTKTCSVVSKNEGSPEDLRKNGKNKSKVLSVIDGRRAQNCTILLSKLKMSDEEISNMILNMDAEDMIPLDMIEQLLKFTPSPDEVVLLEEHSYELDTLGRAERFLYEISKIIHYEQRLRCLIYKKKFVVWTNEVESRIKAVMEASREVTCSRRLKKLLEIVLAIGNYMNEGARGNAWGFRMSTLNRLADTKSNSIHGITLLHYIVDVIDRKFTDILLLNDEIPHVRAASKVSLTELDEDMSQLRNNLKDVEREIEFQQLQPVVLGDKFLSVMKEFLFIASSKFSNLENFFRDMNTKFDGAIRLFGENSSNTQPDEFFGIFVKFLIAFSEALQDNNNIKKRQTEKEKSLWQLKNLTPDRKNCENENSVLSKRFDERSLNNRILINCASGDSAEFNNLISGSRVNVFLDNMTKIKNSKNVDILHSRSTKNTKY